MLHELQFPSYNDRDQVTAWIYVPASEHLGIVQLVHGYGEHSRRYFHMIVALMDAGFIVAADDHVGHGATAIANDTWGDWGDAGPHTMMEDEKRLHDLVCEKYPDLPYFMFGHSMGSMIARDYSATYGEDLAGVVYCGTTGIFKTAEAVRAKLDAIIEAGGAHDSDPALLGELMGWMFARCEEGAALGNEWICHDRAVQLDHANDPFDAFTHPTHNISLRDFIDMMTFIQGTEWAAKVPVELPIYLIAGDQDPVGCYGEGVYQCANWLIDTGHDVETKLYSGYRHEIHNYDDLKFEVEDDLVQWLLCALLDYYDFDDAAPAEFEVL